MRGSHFYSAFLLDFSPHGGIWQNKNNGAKWGGRQRMFSIVPSILMAFLFPYNYYAFAYPILIQLIIPFRLYCRHPQFIGNDSFSSLKLNMPRVEFAGSSLLFICASWSYSVISNYPIPKWNNHAHFFFVLPSIVVTENSFLRFYIWTSIHARFRVRYIRCDLDIFMTDDEMKQTKTKQTTNNKQSHS